MIEDWNWKWWTGYIAACLAVGAALAYPVLRAAEYLHIYRSNVRGIT